jgi:hypothetical protein
MNTDGGRYYLYYLLEIKVTFLNVLYVCSLSAAFSPLLSFLFFLLYLRRIVLLGIGLVNTFQKGSDVTFHYNLG